VQEARIRPARQVLPATAFDAARQRVDISVGGEPSNRLCRRQTHAFVRLGQIFWLALDRHAAQRAVGQHHAEPAQAHICGLVARSRAQRRPGATLEAFHGVRANCPPHWRSTVISRDARTASDGRIEVSAVAT